jgi:hypothetical protein
MSNITDLREHFTTLYDGREERIFEINLMIYKCENNGCASYTYF